ncbi:MAG: hypothetical protein MUD17_03705 [Gemmatimonadaceae bacterium]|jgi:hypothetical protein|nr:hypothetical protein [Gemmatimonadaceae bacterium]
MAIWDKLKQGIDKVEKVATEAIDEGKTRLDARRARQATDQAAQALGYAVYRAWEQGQPLDAVTLDRLARALREHEQTAVRLEAAAGDAAEWRKRGGDTPPAASAPPPSDPPATEPGAGPTGPT